MTSVTVTLQKDSRHLVFRCSKRAVHIIEKPIFRVFSLLDLVFTHAVHPPEGRRVNSVCVPAACLLSLLQTLCVLTHLSVTLLSRLFFPFQRRPCHGHQRRHRGGQGQAGPPRAPQIQTRQLFHQWPQFIFSSTLHPLNSITDYNERPLTAGFRTCVYTEHPYSNAQPHPQTSMLLLRPVVDVAISPPCLEYVSMSSLCSKG